MPYEDDKIYFFIRIDGKDKYVAKLNELDKISKFLKLDEEATVKFLLDLIQKRINHSKRSNIRETLNLILFDPYAYFLE